MSAVATQPNSIVEPPDCPADGAYYGVGFAEYSRWKAVNWHALEPFRVSALRARLKMTTPEEATKSMVSGEAFHTAILEPAKFDAIYSIMPDFEGHHNSTAYKDKKKAWLETHSEAVMLTTDELHNLRGMQRAVSSHPTTSAILSSLGRNEISIVWHDKESGERCKGRVDRLCRIPASVIDPGTGGELICAVDFKTTSRIDSFDNEVAKWGYFGQMAFYEDGLSSLEPGNLTPLIVAVESEPPFDVVVHTCADAVDHGRRLYRRLMKQLTQAKKSNRWPGMCPVGAIPIVLPAWAREPDKF